MLFTPAKRGDAAMSLLFAPISHIFTSSFPLVLTITNISLFYTQYFSVEYKYVSKWFLIRGLHQLKVKANFIAKVEELAMWSDVETGRDFLNFNVMARLVSQMIVDANGSALSIGISGGWGVGKSLHGQAN